MTPFVDARARMASLNLGVAEDAPEFASKLTLVEEPFRDDSVEEELRGSFLDVLGAAGRLENTVASTIAMVQRGGNRVGGITDPSFDRFADTEGYDDNLEAFVYADSPEEVALVKRQIDQERADRQMIASAGGWGIAAMIAAGVIDPINLIPVGATAGVAVKSGNLLKSAVITARSAAVGATMAESVLHFSQVDRSLKESAAAVTGATVLGGLLGTGIGALGKRQLRKVAQEIEEQAAAEAGEIAPKIGAGSGIGGGSGGGGAVDRAQRAVAIERATYTNDEIGRTAAEEDLKGMLGLGKAIKNLGPALRTSIKSRSAVFRGGLQRLTSNALSYAKNTAAGGSRATGAVDIEITGGVGNLVGRKATVVRPRGVDVEDAARLGGRGQGGVGSGKRVRGFLPGEQIEILEELPNGQFRVRGVVQDRVRVRADIVGEGVPEVDSIRRGEHDLFTVPAGEVIETFPTRAQALTRRDELLRETPPTKEVTVDGNSGRLVATERGLALERVDERAVDQTDFKPELLEGEGAVRGKLTDVAAEEAGPPVETAVLLWDANLSRARKASQQIWAKYSKRVPKQQRWTRARFNERAGQAARRGDETLTPVDPPEVSEMAQVYRREIFDPIGDDALALDLVKGLDPKTAKSYFTRVWDIPKLVANRGQFLGVVREWLAETRPDLDVVNLDQQAELIFNHVTKVRGGRVAYDAFATAGPLKERVFDIPDEFLSRNHGSIEEFLVDDIEEVAAYYMRTVVPDVELKRAFGSVDLKEFIEAGTTDYSRQLDEVESALGRNEISVDQSRRLNKVLSKQRDEDISDIEAMRDRIRGTFAAPENPHEISTRSLRVARNLNVLRVGGKFMIASIPDVMRVGFVHGYTRTFRTGIVPIMRHFNDLRLSTRPLENLDIARELEFAAIGIEKQLDDLRFQSMADIGTAYRHDNRFERFVGRSATRMGKLNGLSAWNTNMKQISGIVTQGRMLDAMEAAAKGNISKKELEKLLSQGIDLNAAKRMHALFQRHGKTDRGMKVANSSDWVNGLEGEELGEAIALMKLFRGASLNEVNKIIVTPGVGDLPLWTSKEFHRTIFQFKSFAVASTTRVLASGLQQRDLSSMMGFALSGGMGMFVFGLRTWLAGKAMPDEMRTWVKEGIDRSGTIGILSDLGNLGDKVGLGPSRIIGGQPLTRYASRNLTSSLIGPTGGLAETATETLGSVSAGDVTQRDVRNGRFLLPYQNLFWASWLFDMMESSFNEAFDVPERSQGR